MYTQEDGKTVGDCMESRDNCRKSIFSNSDFYCTDVTLMGAWLWILLMIVPTFTLNLLIMLYSLRRQFLNVVSMWPPFLFSGNFSPFLFGPVPGLTGVFTLSPWLTLLNIAIAMVQGTISMYIFNQLKGMLILTLSITAGKIVDAAED